MAMCQDIADAGNGVYIMSTSPGEILGKTSSLVHAGRTSFIKDVSIDWKVPSDSAVRFVGQDTLVHQAPHTIESIYPGHRFIVFALIKHDHFPTPQEVVVKGKQGDQEIEIQVPVELAKFSDEEPRIPLIHTLAAQRLIRSTLSGDIHTSPGVIHPDDHIQATVTRLALEHSLVTPYTSFIAVEGEREFYEATPVQSRVKHHLSSQTIPNAGTDQSSDDLSRNLQEQPGWSDYLTAWASFGTNYLSSFGSSLWSSVFTSWWPASGGNSVAEAISQETDAVENAEDTCTSDDLSTMSSLLSYSDSDWSDVPRRRPVTPLLEPNPRSPSPQLSSTPSHAPAGDTRFATQASPVNQDVFTLIGLQAFDGSFLPGDQLARIVGVAALSLPDDSQIDEKLWATAVAVAYLRKHLSNQQELLDGLVEKAVQFARDNGLASGSKFEALVQRAKSVLV